MTDEAQDDQLPGREIENTVKKHRLMGDIIAQLPSPVIFTQEDTQVSYTNHLGKELLDSWEKAFKGMPPELLALIKRAEKTYRLQSYECQLNKKSYLLNIMWMDEFEVVAIFGSDITKIKTEDGDTINLKKQDPLTCVANRIYLEEHIEAMIEAHQTNQQKLALILINIDDFKSINNALGTDVGDEFLKLAVKRFENCIKKNDFIGRFCNDEFMIVLSNTSPEVTKLVSKKLIETLSSPIQYKNHLIEATCSLGISIFPDTAKDKNALIQQAIEAMQTSKRSDPNQFTIYAPKGEHGFQERRTQLKKELSKAPENDLYITYQPFFQLNTSTIAGFESYLRWQHPEHGLIYPLEFIPIAEETGTMKTIGLWSIEQALSDFSSKLKLNSQVKLTLNISLDQVNDPRFLDTLVDSIRLYGLDPTNVILDLPYPAMEENTDLLNETIKSLSVHNLSIGYDHFENPLMPLTKLTKTPINYLKLSRDFIIDIESNQKAQILLKGLLELAQNLDIQIVQTGVETKEQHSFLKQIGCPYAQGNIYCKPITLSDMEAYLQRNKR